MKENSKGASTQELWARLFRAATADCFLAENGSAAELPLANHLSLMHHRLCEIDASGLSLGSH